MVTVITLSLYFAARTSSRFNGIEFLSIVCCACLGVLGCRFILQGLHQRLFFADPPRTFYGLPLYLLAFSMVALILMGMGAMLPIEGMKISF